MKVFSRIIPVIPFAAACLFLVSATAAGMQAKDADATITLSRETLNNIVLRQTTLKDAIAKGDVEIAGNEEKLNEMLSYLDSFKFWFNIVTPQQGGTASAAESTTMSPGQTLVLRTQVVLP